MSVVAPSMPKKLSGIMILRRKDLSAMSNGMQMLLLHVGIYAERIKCVSLYIEVCYISIFIPMLRHRDTRMLDMVT